MADLIVIGGGAAGMMAALTAARAGADVALMERNPKVGRKLYITGKGRCNVTNHCSVQEVLDHTPRNGRFLYGSMTRTPPAWVEEFFQAEGVPLKVERGNRVFPESDRAADIIDALVRALRRCRVPILQDRAQSILLTQEGAAAAVEGERGTYPCKAVILATGGLSYPATGSTGDGYRFARGSGHQVTELSPSLVPMEVKEWYAGELMGLSLRNIEIRITDGKKKLYQEFGEMLFTHYGVTGPVILSASSIVGKRLKNSELTLHIDLKPALTEEQLDKRILREFEANHNRQFKNSTDRLFPAKLRPVMVELSGIPEDKKVNEITKEERLRFVRLIKDFPMTLTGLRGYNEAIITKGGVSVRDIDPGTMGSKRVHGLYFAGEVLDLDAVTGGYNLQIAWSTGYLAGMNAGNQ